MKFLSVKLERFGHFAGTTVELGEPGLQLVYGANEAGKSTLLAALRAVLFSFPRQQYDFRFPEASLVVGARLAFADGSQAEVRREKGRGLRGKLGEVKLSDDELRRRLGHPSEALFARVFAFGLAELAAGGEALADEGLRAALSAASVGSARSPEAVLGELDRRLDELYTERAQKKPLNLAWAACRELGLELRRRQLRGEDYRALEDRLRAAEAAAAELRARRETLLHDSALIDAALRGMPHRDQLAGAEREAALLGPTPPLPPAAGEEFARARVERDRLAAQVRDREARLARARGDLEGGELQSSADGLARTRATLAQRLDELKPGWTLDQLAALRLSAADRAAFDGARARVAALEEQQRETTARHTQRSAALAAGERALAALPAPAVLDARLGEITAARSGDAARREQLASEAAEQRRLDGEMARLRARLDPPWTGAALDALPVPRIEEVRHHRAVAVAAAQRRAAAAGERDRLRAERQRLGERPAPPGGAVPSLDELGRLRAVRDALWAQVRRIWLDGGLARESGSGELFRVSSERKLAGEYGEAVAAVDRYADELRRRSDEVAALVELQARAAELDQGLAAAAVELAAAEDAAAAAQAAWGALWERCGFAPHSPDSMLEWLVDYAALHDLAGARAQLAQRAARLAAQVAEHHAALRAALGAGSDDSGRGADAAEHTADVEALHAEAEHRLAAHAAAAAAHAGRRREVETARAALAELDERRAVLDGELGSARAAAAAARQSLGLGALDDAHAARVVDGLFETRRALEQLQLDEERAALRRAELRRAADAAAAELGELRGALAAADAGLADWRARAGAADDAAFLAAADAARRAHQLAGEIAAAERALTEARGALPVDEFTAALAGERALLESRRADLATRRRALDDDLGAAHQQVGTLLAELRPHDGTSQAAETSLQLEARRHDLRAHAVEYATLALARALLARQLDRFQAQAQPQLLESVSRLFCALTDGRYPRVYQRLDDQATFVAVRTDGAELPPAALSSGTREQLFLAVRLAYVEHYCRHAEPLPLVLDDVLVDFDDARAARALAVLGEFAAVTQVMLFTCHRHTVELAAQVVPGATVRELG